MLRRGAPAAAQSGRRRCVAILDSPGLNNTFAILDFFSWVATGEQTGEGFRYERVAGGEIRQWVPETRRQEYASFFSGVGAFVFTIGLAEVWQDRETGGVFWRGIPDEIFDANRHVSRATTVEENAGNLRKILDLVRRLNPKAPVILTLSPVPLMATFRDISCLTADCVSKSILRVALDQVMSDRRSDVYYWPSFEIVKWVGANLPWSAYGEKDEARKVNHRLVKRIVDEFMTAFYTPHAREIIRARVDEQQLEDEVGAPDGCQADLPGPPSPDSREGEQGGGT